MAPLTQSGAAFGAANPTNVLNEIRDIGNGVNGIEQNLQQLRMLQDRALNETDSNSGTSRQLDQLSADTMSSYRSLVQRVRELKGKPDARSYQGQVDRIDRQLKSAIQQFQEVEASHRRKMQGQMERQYMIVRPDADPNEVRAAVEDMSAGGQQVFQQAMMQSNRQGQARAVLNDVQNRHKELLKIEQQITELAQLMQDLDTIIVQQDEPLMKIEHQAEDTVQQLEEANVHLDKANETARATRKKKWICLGICGMLYTFLHMMQEICPTNVIEPDFSPHRGYYCSGRCRLHGCYRQVQQQQQQQRQAQPGRVRWRASRLCCLCPSQDSRYDWPILDALEQISGRGKKHCGSVRASQRGREQRREDCHTARGPAELSFKSTIGWMAVQWPHSFCHSFRALLPGHFRFVSGVRAHLQYLNFRVAFPFSAYTHG